MRGARRGTSMSSSSSSLMERSRSTGVAVQVCRSWRRRPVPCFASLRLSPRRHVARPCVCEPAQSGATPAGSDGCSAALQRSLRVGRHGHCTRAPFTDRTRSWTWSPCPRICLRGCCTTSSSWCARVPACRFAVGILTAIASWAPDSVTTRTYECVVPLARPCLAHRVSHSDSPQRCVLRGWFRQRRRRTSSCCAWASRLPPQPR